MDAELTKVKQEIRGIILSSPRGLNLNSFLKDYKESIGRPFPFRDFGFDSVLEFLKVLKDVVKISSSYGNTLLVPVVSEKVDHINSMVSRQKPPTSRYRGIPLPRRCIVEEPIVDISIRKPVQLPRDKNVNSSPYSNEPDGKTNFQNNYKNNYNGYDEAPEKSRGDQYSNKQVDTKKSYRGPSSYDDSSKSYSNDYSGSVYNGLLPQSSPKPLMDVVHPTPVTQIEGSQYNDKYVKNDSGGYYNKTVVNNLGYGNEDDYNSNIHLEDYSTTDHSLVENGFYNDIDDELDDRPATPGERMFTEKLKNNFRSLLEEHPDGIPSSKFSKLYKEKYGTSLRFRDYQMESIQEMVTHLPDVFSYLKQKSSSNWILYDSRQPIPYEESPQWIPVNIIDNISDLVKKVPSGIKKSEFLILYRASYDAELDHESLGFNSLDSFLFSCNVVECATFDGEEYILPKQENVESAGVVQEDSFALPPASQMCDFYRDYFLIEECGPSMTYAPFELLRKNDFTFSRVFACDIINADCIWLQMDDRKVDLDGLMLGLNEYYNEHEINHILDPAFAIADLICTVRFSQDLRWHRAQILSRNTINDLVKVRYVDYGTENEVNVKELRKLRREFSDLPVQAIKSRLYGIKPVSGETWSVEVGDYLYEQYIEKKFSVNVIEINEEIPLLDVILTDDNGQTVNNWMIRKGFALPSVGQRDTIEERIPAFDDEIQDYLYDYTPILQEAIPFGNGVIMEERRIRTPPGYSSRVAGFNTAEPDQLEVTASTCDKIKLYLAKGMKRYAEIERLTKEIKQLFLEARVLEQMICKHPHECEGIDNNLLRAVMTKFIDEPEQQVQDAVCKPSIDISSSVSSDLGKSESCSSISQPMPGLQYNQNHISQVSHVHQPPGFNLVPQNMGEVKNVGNVGYVQENLLGANDMSSHSQVPSLHLTQNPRHNQHSQHLQPHLLQSQTHQFQSQTHQFQSQPHQHQPNQQQLQPNQQQFQPNQHQIQPNQHQLQSQQMMTHTPHQQAFHNMYSQRMPPPLLNKLVGPPIMVRPGHQEPYMGNRMPYQSQQGMMYPQQNMAQWGHMYNPQPVVPPPGMYGSYRPESIPKNMNSMRPSHPQTASRTPQSSTYSSEGVAEQVQQAEPQPETSPPVNDFSNTPSNTPSPGLEDKVNNLDLHEKVINVEEKCEDEVVETYEDTEHFTEAVAVETEEFEGSSPPPFPELNVETSHLTSKQIKKLGIGESKKISPPPSNNWRDFAPGSSNSTDLPNALPSFSDQSLINALRDEDLPKEKKLDNEMKKFNDAITDRLSEVNAREVVNPIMKIYVTNIRGASEAFYLLLVDDNIAVLLKQLYSGFWWGDYDDDSYADISYKIIDENLLGSSLFYSDYSPIFEKLKKEKLIDEEDLYLAVVNLCDVPKAVDIICPPEQHDLSETKSLFEQLNTLVLPIDVYWYRSERSNEGC